MKSCSVKRLLGLVLVLACILAVTAVPVVSVNAAATYVAGDANGDGSVNSKDVVRLLYHVLYPTDSGYALSCEGDVNGDGTTNNEDVVYLMYHIVFGDTEYPLEVTAKTGLTVNGVDISNFKIIRPYFNSSYLTRIEMESMVSDIAKKGYTLSIADDTQTAEGTYEIIVGNCDRSGVKKVTADDTYTITVAGTKVYLNGDSPHATAMAVSEFAKMLKKGNVTNAQSMSGNYSTAIKSYDASTHYTYKWGDDFDTATIDTTKWRVYGEDEFGREGWNGKWTAMTNDPNYVFNMDSNLYILGHETATTYYGGSLSTNKTMTYQYGYVETSSIVPDGDGFWSALWFCGASGGTNKLFSPEIDLNECFGDASLTTINCHAWPTGEGRAEGWGSTGSSASFDDYNAAVPTRRYYPADGSKLSDTYHTYGFLWTKDKFEFIFDGNTQLIYEFDNANYLIKEDNKYFTATEARDTYANSYMYMINSFSVGRLNNGLGITDDPFEWNNTNRFVCDYINLYQLNNGYGGLYLNGVKQ